MRRALLNPPQPVLSEAATSPPAIRPAAGTSGPSAPATAGERGLSSLPARGRLQGPEHAEERRRALFHPRRGWFRRLERAISNFIAGQVYPRCPGINLPYDHLLQRQLTLSEAEIPLAGLPDGFEGLKILLITDVHAGPLVSPRALRESFVRLLEVEPDLVLLGGDLATRRLEEIETHRSAFAALHAPLGVFAVLGNHDHYTESTERLRRMLDATGIVVLHNRSVQLKRGTDRLSLAGVDDLLLGRADLAAALESAPPPVVLLSHNPDLIFDAARNGVALVLSGHTHGGQIRLPGLPVLVRQSRYRLDEGRFRAGSTELVVSRGLGVVGLPWRTGCPPEAVLVRLARGD